ncbi:helix-turn-helix domain-containing protein [Pseudoalteromonas phenolica]|uniref:AraC family transcriptional regulator n=2 Tax=Pseudoalteromonas phenolica TaxID=161398 RepID=A0A0S2K0L7_9GAMM|nr:helix-turn-helix domain-containing protein [Pseudoalteromonas phenolica]ALO41672.1 hypothetical protein PP2015_1156 [Pseudoalteromonas phenolica]MBE0353778.1 hypothetical protein [Pseudoalteromonas phenolica O-BC30]
MEIRSQVKRSPFDTALFFKRSIEQLLDNKFNHLTRCDFVVEYHTSHAVSHFWPKSAQFEKPISNIPINYQRKPLGTLHLLVEVRQGSAEELAFKQFASQLGLMFARLKVAQLSHEKFGQNFALQGYSAEINKLERLIEKCANTLFPLVLNTPMGSETLATAISIHMLSDKRTGPFIELDCTSIDTNNFENKLKQAFEQAQNGSLLIANVSHLPMSQQTQLNTLLTSQYSLSQNTSQPRLLSSSEHNLYARVNQGLFSRGLFEKLSFLELPIPSIKDRKTDLPLLINILFERHKINHKQKLTKECFDLLSQYDWPGNIMQLEQTLVKLITLSHQDDICSEILKQTLPEFSQQLENCVEQTAGEHRKSIVKILLKKQVSEQRSLHPSLLKALIHMQNNWHQEITLTGLANQAFVSPSHLSYLFKNSLNKSFKQILAELRIEHAKAMIEENPNIRITDLCLEVGFGDLSHFEKIFRRFTGMSPREFKKQYKSYRI